MPNSTIPNLPSFLGTPSGTEPMETVQSGLSVQIPSQKIADLATIVTPINLAGMTSLISGSQVSVYKLYVITNSTQGRILVKGLSTTTLEAGALNLTTGASGTYVFGTDTFTPSAGGNANITPITVTALQNLRSTSALSLTTLYIITDATPYKLMCKAETVSQLSKTATIVDAVYSGQVYYDLQIDTISNGTIYDADGNTWNGCFPNIITLGTGCLNNQFNALSIDNSMGNNCSRNIFTSTNREIILGDGCVSNTFGQASQTFIFANNLQFVTIEAGLGGSDYTASPDYDFLYNNTYASTIFQSGGINYHRYYDPANDRIVLRNLSTPLAAPTYIGGGVVGPASAVNNNIALYDNTTGKLIKDGGYSVSTSTADIASSVKVPVWTAIVTYVTGLGYLLASTAASTYQAILTAANMHTFVDSLNTMTTPADSDRFLIVDNSASLAKKITWANIKATLKTYFDSLTTTLTNKRITARSGTVASSGTPTINTDNVDYYSITALAAPITSFTTNLLGAPTIGQTLWISIKDDGTARAITWGTSFEASTIALPTTTVTTARLDVAFIWNEATSKWRCVGVA